MKKIAPLLPLFLNYLYILAGSLAFSWLLQSSNVFQTIDAFLFTKIVAADAQGFAGTLTRLFDHSYNIFPVTIPTFYFLYIGLALIYIALYHRKHWVGFVLSLFFASVLAVPVMNLNWEWLPRERPFQVLTDIPDSFNVKAWQHLPSYPSGHALGIALIGTIIATYIPRLRWPLLIFVLLASITRIYLGAHFPLDVLAGILLGYYIGLLGMKIYNLRQSLLKE